jgi:site-specific recombinase XerD
LDLIVDQQGPYATSVSKRDAPLCRLVRFQRHSRARAGPFHVAAFVHDLQEELSPPSVKQHLAAIRMLFDWLVTGHVIDTNPAHSVRGPRYTVKKGKTPAAGSQLTLFSDDKPDRFFTVIKFWTDSTLEASLALRSNVPFTP